MAELTLEQQKVLARARARIRTQQTVEPAAAASAVQEKPLYTDVYDPLKAAGTEAAKTVIGMPGALGDVQGMTGDLANWLSEKTGLGDPETVRRVAQNTNPLLPLSVVNSAVSEWFGGGKGTSFPKSSEFIGAAQQAGVPLDYEAQSKLGELGGRIGGMIPAAAAGPGRIASKVALAVVPSITGQGATETARRLGVSEPTAKTVGDVAGLLTAGPMVVRQATKATRAKLPDISDEIDHLKNRENVLWRTLRSQGVKYDNNAWDTFIKREVRPDLQSQGVTKNVAKSTYKVIKDMEKAANDPLDFSTVDGFRREAQQLRGSNKSGDRAGGAMLGNKIEKFISSGPAISTTGITNPQIKQLHALARETSARRFKGEDAINRIKAAEGYTSGVQSGIVNQFGNLKRRIETKTAGGAPKTRSRYTPAEIKQLERVIGGSTGRKVAYSAGSTGANVIKGAGRANLLPVAGGTIGGYLGQQFLGPLGTVVGPAIQQGLGIIAKKGAQSATVRDAEKFARMVMRDPRQRNQAAVDEYIKALRALGFSPQVGELTGRRQPPGLLD